MYFIQIEPIKQKLRNRTLSDRDMLPYLIAYSLLIAVISNFSFVQNFNMLDWVCGFFSVTLTVFGVIYAYIKNGGKDGFDLLLKYIVIGWIVTVRLILIIIPCAIVLLYVSEITGYSTDGTNIVDVIFIIICEVILYARIGKHISDTKTQISAQ